jgi:hypothetical protein
MSDVSDPLARTPAWQRAIRDHDHFLELEGLVVHQDSVHRVAQTIGIVRHEDGHRLAHVADHLGREDALDVGTGAGGLAERRRDPARDLRQVRGGEHQDSGHLASLVRGDPPDARVGVQASHHREVGHARPSEVVQVPPPTEEEWRVLPSTG